MLYQRRVDAVEATVSTDAEQVAALVGGTVVSADEGAWTVITSAGRTYAGQVGDYLEPVGTSWRVVPAADFEAVWMPPPADWVVQADELTTARAGLNAAASTLAEPTELEGVKAALSAVTSAVLAILATYGRA